MWTSMPIELYCNKQNRRQLYRASGNLLDFYLLFFNLIHLLFISECFDLNDAFLNKNSESCVCVFVQSTSAK